jgi:hypothetical protein
MVGLAIGTYSPQISDAPWVDAVLRHSFSVGASKRYGGAFTDEQIATAISEMQKAQFDLNSPWSELLSADTLNPNSITYTGELGILLRANPQIVEDKFINPVTTKLESYFNDQTDAVQDAFSFNPRDPYGFTFENFTETRRAAGARVERRIERTSDTVMGGKLLNALRGYHFFVSQIFGQDEAIRRSTGLANAYGIKMAEPLSTEPSRTSNTRRTKPETAQTQTTVETPSATSNADIDLNALEYEQLRDRMAE